MENLHLPIDYLMPEIKSLILSIEEKMNCPRDFATTAVFAIASGAIGNRIQTNDGVYKNRLNINVCHVAPPGSNKTAPVSLLLKPLVAIHDEIIMQSRMERKNFEASKGSDEKPLPKILFASNPTPEAINKFLAYNPRGIFVRRDELKGFIEDLSGRYNSGDGGVSDFLSTFTNESISIIRSGEEPLSIPQPYLSVMGGIQPSILKDVLGKKLLMGNGFNYRWLFVYPDIEISLTRQHEGVDKKALEYWHIFVKCLWNIAPMEFTFSDAAQKLLDEYYRKIAEKKIEEKEGQETPYYYIGDKQRLAFVRVGNESVVADRLQLKSLVMSGAGRSFDAIPSPYKFEDMSFSKLKSVHFKRLNQSFDDNDFVSWGIVDNDGKLTNAGALLADDSPIRHSRIFCTHWNGLDMTSGLGEALDDAELEGSVISQLQDAVAFVRNNSHRRWWKEAEYREELPDYPERAVTEVICNAIIHRDYMELGSEIHIDMYDDRMEVYSPGGMFDGRLIQQLNPLTVPSKRRNPLLADFFHRLKLMERRGSGMKKIIGEYKRFDTLENYHAPEFSSNATEFHVTLWNLNYGVDVVKDNLHVVKEMDDVVKDVVKEKANATKEFAKAQRQIYKLISQMPQISAAQMSENMGISLRQVQRYLKQLSDQNLIVREGGRKNGVWKILDDEYEGFFKRI